MVKAIETKVEQADWLGEREGELDRLDAQYRNAEQERDLDLYYKKMIRKPKPEYRHAGQGRRSRESIRSADWW